jgi:DNA repair exonuclease SbcCD ATPase subunit
MLHLAQVEKRDPEGKVEFKLLAQQKSEYTWTVITDAEYVFASEGVDDCKEGSLVLLELSNTRQVKHIQDATSWVLALVDEFLVSGITPATLQEETERAEQWRQALTLQSQELGRRALEMEARRDQIQELEENLKREKKQLELLATELKTDEQELDQRALELEARQDQIQQLEENLRREKKRLELLAAELKTNINMNP